MMADDAHEQIHVDAPPERCFALATAFEEYPEWAKRREAGDRARCATPTVAAPASSTTWPALGRRVRYVLDYDFADAPHAFSWSLVEGDMLRALDGRYVFDAADDGTHVDYTLRVDLADPDAGPGEAAGVGHDHGDRVARPQARGGGRGSMSGGDASRGSRRAATRGLTPASRRAPTPTSGRSMSGSEPTPHPDAVDFESAGTEERPLPAAVGARERDHRAARRGARGAGPRAAGGRRAARRREGAHRRRRPGGAPAARRRPERVGDTATFGVDLGGTNLRVALVDPDGTIVEQRRVPTPPTLDGIVDTITGAVRAFAPLRPEARALGVGRGRDGRPRRA